MFRNKVKICIFYSILIIIFPLIFFILSEIMLKVSGYGENFNFLIKDKSVRPVIYRHNPKFIQPYFSKLLKKSAMPMAVPAVKPENTYRVFVLGGSAGAGYPEPPFGFSRIFEVMLKNQFPNTNIEVYNASIVAINSHILLKMIKDLAPFEADLFVIYVGNNEVVGPYGPGTVFNAFSSNLALIRAGIFVNNTQTGQLLRSFISKFRKAEKKLPTEWKGMEMFAASRIRHNDPQLQKTYEYYQRNLEDIIRVGLKTKAKVALCSVGSNLKDLAPFASLHKEGFNRQQRWSTFISQAEQSESQNDFRSAVDLYERALTLDNDYALTHFRLAKNYMRLENFDKAKEHFTKARDLDVLRFRSVSEINQRVASVAGEFKDNKDFLYIDSVKAFEQNSPHAIVGDEVLYEHVHLNFHGNYLIARSLMEQIQTHLPENVTSRRENNNILTEEEAKNRLGYSGYVQYETTIKLLKLIQREPFSTIDNYQDIISKLKAREKTLSRFNEPEGLAEAEEIYYQALQKNPYDKWLHFYLACVLIGQGNLEEARIHSNFAAKQMPEYSPAQALFELADNLIKANKNVRVNLIH